MTGKMIVVLVTAAVSSASAATVGVVYTKFVNSNNIWAGVPVADVATNSAPMKSAVVLSAKEGYFDSFKDSSSSDIDAAVCPGGGNSQRCVVVARASDVHLRILGYTLSLPSMWLGGDSQDADPSNGLPSSFFNDLRSRVEVVIHVGRRPVLPSKPGPQADSGTDGVKGPQSQDGSSTATTYGANSFQNPASSEGDSQLVEFDVLTSPLSMEMLPQSVFPSNFGEQYVDPFALFSQGNTSIQSPFAVGQPPWTPPEPGISDGPAQVENVVSNFSSDRRVVVPEASTWTMMIAGFAALGLFKRRRIAAAFRSVVKR